MSGTIRPIATILAITILLLGGVGSVRWAKRNGTGAQLVGSALMLVLGMIGPAIKPPQQGIEEAREDKGKKGSESGDPPAT